MIFFLSSQDFQVNNLMNTLPLSLIHLIYEFDPTFHEVFRKKVLPCLKYVFVYLDKGERLKYRYNPVTGHYVYYQQNQPLRVQCDQYIFRGLLNGRRLDYYTNGVRSMESEWKHNRLHGSKKEYDRHGILRKDFFYQNGKREGLSRHYFEDGALFQECEYKQGKREGKFVNYHKNGDIKMRAVYENDRII